MYKHVVRLNNLKFNATHGLYEYEKNKPQKFELDIEFSYCKSNTCNDDISDLINYEVLYGIVKKVVINNTFDLIESLGERIIQDVFDYYNRKCVLRVIIRKPEVKFDENENCVEVSVSKSNE